MNSNDGRLNWEIPIVSNILPILIGDNICLSSKDGFILNVEKNSGKVIWSKKIFKKLKKLSYEKTGDVTSTLFLSNKLFLTTENGYFIFLNFETGKIISYTLNELEGDFKRTDTVVYNTADDHASCIGDSVLAESANNRANHCANNGISFSLEIG